MRLYGSYLSPYTRRVAVSLNLLGIAFELEEIYTSRDPDKIRPLSPLVRVPALALDDGEVLVESAAILDEIDQIVGSDRALMPPRGAARRRAMQLTAIAVGCMEKTQWALYETLYHPPEKVHEPWIERNEAQALGGLAHIEPSAASLGESGWLADTPSISQADVSLSVAFSFISLVRPALEIPTRFPHLAAFVARCESLDAFAAVPPSQPPWARTSHE